MIKRQPYIFLLKSTIVLAALCFSNKSFSQFYNKEVAAKINMENKGEFLAFTATAENLTPSDFNLRYEFMLFKYDDNKNSTRTSQGDLFFIQAHELKVLSSTTINNSHKGKIILVLLIYDLEDNPIGKDRVELEMKEGGVDQVEKQEPMVLSQEQAKPQDGFFINGLVIENAITKVGRDFYKYFYSEYYNKQVKTPKNIEIEEAPARGRTTRISVKIDNQVVMQFFAQPRKDFLKRMANIALSRSIAYLQQLQQQEANFKHY